MSGTHTPPSRGRIRARAVGAFARFAVAVAVAVAVVAGVLVGLPAGAAPPPARSRANALPALPARWPRAFQIGTADPPGDAAALRHAAPFGFRYQYLAGGVNTGAGWTTWNPDGSFVTSYDDESFAAGEIPVFSYYMLLQSDPTGSNEAETDLAHLRDQALMTTYWSEVRLFFERARGPHTVVLQIEPDLWGYLEQAGAVVLARSFARHFVTLRNALAPNVVLAYHLSEWGSGHDIVAEKPPDALVRRDADEAAAFYRSIGVRFDIAFTDVSDRDAAYYQLVEHNPTTWMGPADFARNVVFDATFVLAARVRLVIWQIPLGNTLMRAENNTWDHYQDNRVQWFLGPDSQAHLRAYRDAGVVALLFGRGADGNTCACDAAGDGVTNPAPIDGNDERSLSADDDGGYFKARTAAYDRAGALVLP